MPRRYLLPARVFAQRARHLSPARRAGRLSNGGTRLTLGPVDHSSQERTRALAARLTTSGLATRSGFREARRHSGARVRGVVLGMHGSPHANQIAQAFPA